jgi:hypothetical protein
VDALPLPSPEPQMVQLTADGELDLDVLDGPVVDNAGEGYVVVAL